MVSYSDIYGLGRVHGQDGTAARMLPLSVDGLILTASLVLLHEARNDRDAPGRPASRGDLRRLPDEHRKMFAAAVHELLRPALDAGAHTGAAPWPGALRIHRIGRDYSMTSSFAGPDGRALFRLAEVAGDPVVIWLRAGNHDIYNN